MHLYFGSDIIVPRMKLAFFNEHGRKSRTWFMILMTTVVDSIAVISSSPNGYVPDEGSVGTVPYSKQVLQSVANGPSVHFT